MALYTSSTPKVLSRITFSIGARVGAPGRLAQHSFRMYGMMYIYVYDKTMQYYYDACSIPESNRDLAAKTTGFDRVDCLFLAC